MSIDAYVIGRYKSTCSGFLGCELDTSVIAVHFVPMCSVISEDHRDVKLASESCLHSVLSRIYASIRLQTVTILYIRMYEHTQCFVQDTYMHCNDRFK